MVEFVDAIPSRESTCALPILAGFRFRKERPRTSQIPPCQSPVCLQFQYFFVAIRFTISDFGQWFPNIIELVFALNQRSKNSKNWAKEPTINCGFLTWLFHGNHQFFETETFAGGSAFFSTFLWRVKHQGGGIAKIRGLGQGAGDSQAQPRILGMSQTLGQSWYHGSSFLVLGTSKNFHNNPLQISDPRLFFGWYMAGA